MYVSLNDRVKFTAEVVAYETDNSSIGEIICERAADTNAAAVIMVRRDMIFKPRHRIEWCGCCVPDKRVITIANDRRKGDGDEYNDDDELR